MTLRVTLEVVPFGEEGGKYEIFSVDINNTGLIEDRGFGHQICSYEFFVKRPIPDILRQPEGPTHDIEGEGVVPSHDRRDGALRLVQAVLNTHLEEVE